jgi:hypothetical protein
MVVVNKRAPNLGGFSQEKLAKEDLRLLISSLEKQQYPNVNHLDCTTTRLEMLIGKLKRMLK